MRWIGYTFLMIGFGWTVAGVLMVRPTARAIVVHRYDQLTAQDTFTREEVQRHIREPVFELVEAMPWFVCPAMLMLVGGVCLDRARRKCG